MGNSSEKNSNQQIYNSEIMTVTHSICTDYGLRTLTRGKYVPEVNKWTINAEHVCTKDLYRLELFRGDLSQMKGLQWKRLGGKSFMPFQFHSMRGNVQCFGYRSMGNVIDYFHKNNLIIGSQRESVLIHILRDILIGIRDFDLQRLCHPKLTWENIEILHNGCGAISGLEYLIPKDKVNIKKIAPRHHLPPECLKCVSTTQPQLENVQMWSLGSQLLAILINKYISGHKFDKPTEKMSKRRALKNIHKNKTQLSNMLIETSLSMNMQEFLKGLLEIDLNCRTTLGRALVQINKYSSKLPIALLSPDLQDNASNVVKQPSNRIKRISAVHLSKTTENLANKHSGEITRYFIAITTTICHQTQ